MWDLIIGTKTSCTNIIIRIITETGELWIWKSVNSLDERFGERILDHRLIFRVFFLNINNVNNYTQYNFNLRTATAMMDIKQNPVFKILLIYLIYTNLNSLVLKKRV